MGHPLQHPLDALYFSVVTITTVGYGDLHPVMASTKMLVMGEIGSGVLMLVWALPLLVSRLANW